MMKAKRIKPVDGGFFLPEAIIQDIQSFLGHKEAARTAILSKSWYNAWLTRPLLHFDQSDFQNGEKKLLKITHKFVYFTAKTMQRYKDSNMKIERFTLRMSNNINDMYLAKALILDAVKLGATDLNIELHKASLVVPQELIRSETLVRLHLREFHLGEKFRCWRLNLLSLDRVSIKNGDVMRGMLSCCIWIEELSFSKCTMMNSDSVSLSTLRMSGLSLHELHKLRRLFLEEVEVDSLFFSDLSRLHCLKELILVRCRGSTTIEIASTSLQHIKFVTKKAAKVKLDVPNIHIFSYSGKGLPKSLCIKADASREWESYISLTSLTPQKSCWFKRLRHVLDKLRASKINLYLNLCGRIVDEEGSSVALPQPASTAVFDN